MRKLGLAVLLTIAGALLVSAMKAHQVFLAIILLLVIVVHLIRIYLRSKSKKETGQELFILTTCGVIGYLTESWGTAHGHWTYYHLPEGQSVPLWVPVAWSIAALLLGKTEAVIHDAQAKWAFLNSPLKLNACIYFSGIFLPLIGEAICIANGVWEYHWPLKILGVPLLALLLIAYAHFDFSLIRVGSRTQWS